MVAAVLIFIPLIFISFVFLIYWKRIKDVTVMIWRAYFNLSEIAGPKAYPIIGSVWQFKLNSSDFFVQMAEWSRIFAFSEGSKGIVKMWLGPIPVALVIRPAYCKHEREVVWPEEDAHTGISFQRPQGIPRDNCQTGSETAMSTQLNAQEGKNSEYVTAVARISDMLFTYGRSPWLWLTPVWYGSGLGFEFDRLVKMTTDFTRQVIVERRQTLIDEGRMEESGDLSKKRMAFLEMMLLNQEKNALSDEDIREEVDTFMFEGHDTTASGMGWTIWLLGQHPEYQARVHAEMDDVFGDDEDREPSEEDLKKYIYLEMCIKESLRLCQPVPIIARRLTHDLILDEFTLPKDLTTLIVPIATHRNPKDWERPSVFYPDHFLPDAVAKRHPFAYFPFSAGPRNCFGQKFAQAEEKTVLSYFFRKYRVESVTPLPGNRFVPEE